MFAFSKKIREWINNAKSSKNLILGLAIILLTLIIALCFTNRFSRFINIIAVFISMIGTFIGSLIFAQGISSYRNTTLEKRIETEVLQKQRLKNYEKLEGEFIRVNEEKKRLENMKIHAEDLNAIAKLSLLEFDLSLYDFKDEVIEKTTSKVPLFTALNEKETSINYVGLICHKFKARLGIDLNKIRICELENKIYVSGIEAEYQGMLDNKSEWKINEIRKRVSKNNKKISDIFLPNDPRLVSSMLKQEEELKNIISNGIDLKANEKVLISLGMQFVKLILKPLNKNIEFSENISPKVSMPLIDYISEKNKLIDDKISKLF